MQEKNIIKLNPDGKYALVDDDVCTNCSNFHVICMLSRANYMYAFITRGHVFILIAYQVTTGGPLRDEDDAIHCEWVGRDDNKRRLNMRVFYGIF